MRVANALKELKDPRATMPLVEALEDPCEDVKRAAAWALSWVGDERARPALIRALENENDSVRLWAAIGLQRVGDEGAVEGLIGALKDPDEGVRLQAVYALAEIGDKRAVEPLLEALNDEDTFVQEAARDNLRDAFGVDTGSGYVEAARARAGHNLSPRSNRIKSTHPHAHKGRARGLMEAWDPGYRGIVAGRMSCLGQAGSCSWIFSPLLQGQQHSPLKDLKLTERMPIFCLICQSLCPPGQVICSEKCHETLIQRLEQEFGTHMKVVDLKTMKAYSVPLRDIVDGGLRRKNLKYFSEWK